METRRNLQSVVIESANVLPQRCGAITLVVLSHRFQGPILGTVTTLDSEKEHKKGISGLAPFS